LIACLLAVFKIGGTYVPLNVIDPEKRILSIVDTAKLKFLVTNSENNIDLHGKCNRLNIEELMEEAKGVTVTHEPVITSSDDPAYVLFTSGTTGTPKGVLVNHKATINIIEWVNKTFGVTRDDKLLWVTNLSFDLSVYDIFGILASGASLRILTEEERHDPKQQLKIVLDEGITFWDSAPQSLQQVTMHFDRWKEIGSAHASRHNLKRVFLSGDWIPVPLPPIVKSFFPEASMVGLGGATENTVWSNYYVINDIKPEWKSIPYGKPIQNVRYYVLDEKLRHCRINQPGDLYVGGVCLAEGYYNDPVLTAKKFIDDPYNPGEKIYYTGDKSQWMPDGNVEFLGREDDQIKVRGYRIETGEIKNAVLNDRRIKEAIILADKSDRHDVKLILYVCAAGNEKLDLREIKGQLRVALPEYMVPAVVLQLDEIPLNPNGKVDGKKLLAQYAALLHESEKQAPGPSREFTATEKIIYDIWKEALKRENITHADNFFDIGGDSMLAITVFSKIERAFNINLKLRIFFDSPHLGELSDTIDLLIMEEKRQKNQGNLVPDNDSLVTGEI
jgi:amino acid adenylation domain-containing protein